MINVCCSFNDGDDDDDKDDDDDEEEEDDDALALRFASWWGCCPFRLRI